MDKLILKASERNLDIKLQDLRLDKQIPAVVYGKKIKPMHICLSYSDFLKTFRTWWYTHIIQLQLNDKKQDVIIQDIQKHPVSDNFLHIDLLAIDAKEKIHVNIPINLIWNSPAVKEWWFIDQVLSEIEVKCLTSDLIDQFELDISNLESIWDVLYVKDLNINTSKYELSIPLESPVVSVLDAKVKEEAPVEAAKVEDVWVAGKEEKSEEEKE